MIKSTKAIRSVPQTNCHKIQENIGNKSLVLDEGKEKYISLTLKNFKPIFEVWNKDYLIFESTYLTKAVKKYNCL